MAATPTAETDEIRAVRYLAEAEVYEDRLVAILRHYEGLYPNHPNRATIDASQDLEYQSVLATLQLKRDQANRYALFAILERMRVQNRLTQTLIDRGAPDRQADEATAAQWRQALAAADPPTLIPKDR